LFDPLRTIVTHNSKFSYEQKELKSYVLMLDIELTNLYSPNRSFELKVLKQIAD